MTLIELRDIILKDDDDILKGTYFDKYGGGGGMHIQDLYMLLTILRPKVHFDYKIDTEHHHFNTMVLMNLSPMVQSPLTIKEMTRLYTITQHVHIIYTHALDYSNNTDL